MIDNVKTSIKNSIYLKIESFLDTYILALYILIDFLKRAFRKIVRITLNIGIDKFKTFDIDKIIDRANKLGLEVKHHGFGLYEIYNDKHKIRLKQDIILDKESVVGLFLCGHKCLTFRILENF